MKRRTLLLTAGLVAAPSIVSAQAFPANPVRLIHGYDAGSNPDTIARHLSQPLTEIMGVQIVIEPKPGAAERVAATQVARMKPDGNVLYLMTGGQAVVSATDKSLSYDLLADFDFISIVTRFPFVFTVAPESRFRTMAAYLDEARREPGKLTYGSSGIGTSVHLGGELFKMDAGVDLAHVPYKATPAIVADLLESRLQMSVLGVTDVRQYILSGQIRGLALSHTERLPEFPDIPTFAEVGYPKVRASNDFGISIRSDTPAPIKARLEEAYRTAVRRPEIVQRLKDIGLIVVATSSAEFARVLAEDAARYTEVIRVADVKLE